MRISEYLPFQSSSSFTWEQWDTSWRITYLMKILWALLGDNGRNSCTGNTWHISIRYFGVVEQLYNYILTMDYCPTDEILEDLFTKPLQGTMFEVHRWVIMGWFHIIRLETESMSELKKRVGNDQYEIFNTKIDSSKNGTWTYTDVMKYN